MVPSEEQFQKLRSTADKLSAYREFLNSQKSQNERVVKDLRYKSDLYQKCVELFKKWLEDALDKNVNSMAELATVGLHHVIPDQKLKFKIKQEMKYNRLSMRFILEEEQNDGDLVEGDPINSYGGGAAVVISLILRLAVMSRMNMSNLLLLDESMVALANAYVPACAEFMRQLSEQTGVNILMVTHNPEFISHAHTAYEGYKDDSLKLRAIRTDSL